MVHVAPRLVCHAQKLDAKRDHDAELRDGEHETQAHEDDGETGMAGPAGGVGVFAEGEVSAVGEGIGAGHLGNWRVLDLGDEGGGK